MHQHTVLDTLLYLFDALVYDKNHQATQEYMQEELKQAGFSQKDIDRAMLWLDQLSSLQSSCTLSSTRITHRNRTLSIDEAEKITPQAFKFLNDVLEMGVIDVSLREVILHKLVMLEEHIGENEMAWVILMAIYNKPDQEANIVWLEQKIFEKIYKRQLH